MGIVLVILVICGYTGTLVILLKRKFGECIPITLITMTILMYCSQLVFDTFDIGYIFIIICSIIVFPILFLISEDKKILVNSIFSIGFCVFIITFFILCIWDYKRFFHSWDELSHWGMMTKELLRLDGWYFEDSSRLLVHKEYPPFLSIFEMLFCRLYGGYSEPRVYLGLHMFILSLIVPPIVDRKLYGDYSNTIIISNKGIDGNFIGQKLREILLVVGLCILPILVIICIDPERRFLTIYKDIALPIIFAYAMMLIIDRGVFESKVNFGTLVLSEVAIILTKQMGILFLVLIWFYYGLSYLFYLKEKCENKICNIKKYIASMFFLVIIPLLSQLFWNYNVNAIQEDLQFDLGKISLTEFLNIILNKSDYGLRRQTYLSFIEALGNKNIGNIIFPMSYIAMFVGTIIGIMIIYRIKSKLVNRYEIIILGITFICGTLGYAFTMLMLYLFCYSTDEMKRLASFERYLSSYVLGEIVIIFLLILMILLEQEKMNLRRIYFSMVILLVILGSSNINTFLPGILLEREFSQHRALAEKIETKIAQDSSIFILSKDTIETQYYVNYYMDNIKVSLCYDDILNANFNDNEVFDRVSKVIFENDYLYIHHLTENFNENFGRNIEFKLEEGSLYKLKNGQVIQMVEN